MAIEKYKFCLLFLVLFIIYVEVINTSVTHSLDETYWNTYCNGVLWYIVFGFNLLMAKPNATKCTGIANLFSQH
jgi:hypothetical protein